MATASATYTKLKSGDWGIRVNGTVTRGSQVTVSKKSGETATETVRTVVWTGNGATLCAIEPRQPQRQSPNWDPQRFNGYSQARGGYRKACKTGGNCSSFGSGKSCGGHDCDGW